MMSSRCHCRFSGPADTMLGSHRDPISSEKCWLDFAVRELSRVAAGKARGQEAVWGIQRKPTWWDTECPGMTWKNPTANPKDSKDTLKMKFECLVRHLRQEGKIPDELVEEIGLWEAGKVQEVFLRTIFSSILGQTSSSHTLLDEAYKKMVDTGIGIDSCILGDIKNCLTACITRIDSIKNLAAQKNRHHVKPQASKVHHTVLKRSHDGPDAWDSTPSAKYGRISSPTISSSSSLDSASQNSGSVPNGNSAANNHFVLNSSLSTGDIQKLILASLQQKILKNKYEVEAAAAQQRPQLPARHRRTIAPAPASAKSADRVELVKHILPVAAAAPSSVLAGGAGLVHDIVTLPPSVSYISGDHLGLDMLEEAPIEDHQFLDNLLAESFLLDDQNPIFTSPMAAPEVECTDSEGKLVARIETNPTTMLSPQTSHPNGVAANNIPSVTVSGQSWSLEDENVSLGDMGSDPCLSAGGEISDERYLSDAGYSSESSPSHRISTDSIEDHFEVNNPDFYDLLDSLP